MTDIDIDFKDRNNILNKLHHIPASIIKDNNVARHNTGIYFHEIPVDPFTGNATLDYKKDPELFNETAKQWAESIGVGRGGVQNTQIRKFYDKVLELYEKSQNQEEDFGEILPFVKMLNSKVAYASSRNSAGGKLINKAFVEMMNSCINQVDSKESLAVFKLFFDAVIGFHKSLEGRN